MQAPVNQSATFFPSTTWRQRASDGLIYDEMAHRTNACSHALRLASSGISSTAAEKIRLFQAFSSALVSRFIPCGGVASTNRPASCATTRLTPARTSVGRSSQTNHAARPSAYAQCADCQASPQGLPSPVVRSPVECVATRYRIIGIM